MLLHQAISMPVPCLDGNLDEREQHTHRGEEPLRPLPILLVLFHAAFELRDAATVAVAH